MAVITDQKTIQYAFENEGFTENLKREGFLDMLRPTKAKQLCIVPLDNFLGVFAMMESERQVSNFVWIPIAMGGLHELQKFRDKLAYIDKTHTNIIDN